MKSIKLLAVASVMAITSGCAGVSGITTPHGSLFVSSKGPVAVTSSAASTKSGKACAASYLGFVGLGDASIDAAKKAGGITEVSSVDTEQFGILGLYAKVCTVVSGN